MFTPLAHFAAAVGHVDGIYDGEDLGRQQSPNHVGPLQGGSNERAFRCCAVERVYDHELWGTPDQSEIQCNRIAFVLDGGIPPRHKDQIETVTVIRFALSPSDKVSTDRLTIATNKTPDTLGSGSTTLAVPACGAGFFYFEIAPIW